MVLADVGANVTFTVTLCPPPRVTGNAPPLIENSLPWTCGANKVALQGRAFVSTIDWVELAPIATCPNDTVEGLAVTGSLFTPVPPTSSPRIAFDALLETLIVPPVHLRPEGVKLIFTSTLCPAGNVSGRFKPAVANAVANSELLTVNPETVTLVCPVFVKPTSMVSV